MSPTSNQDRRSFEEDLYLFAKSAAGNILLSQFNEDQLLLAANELYRNDVYHCASIASKALSCIPFIHDDVAVRAKKFLEHILWCTWRTALWKTGRKPKACWRYVGLHHFTSIKGKPTVVIAPTTVPFCDVLDLMTDVLPDVQVVVYGEAIGQAQSNHISVPGNITLVGNDVGGAERILPTLLSGGVFCTYPDFVYDGHKVMNGTMFGKCLNFSSSFVSICARPGIHLLPLRFFREDQRLTAIAQEAILLEVLGQQVGKEDKKRITLQLIISILEAAITQLPEQWIALGTLAAEATPLPA